MSSELIQQVTILLAYGTALFFVFFGKTDMEKIKGMLWAIMILLARIADKVS